MAAKGTEQELRVGNKRVPVTNLDKVFYPEVGFTKGDVIEYYKAIAPVIFPHLKSRPLTLKRYPNGVDAGYFYEKRCPPHRPEWVDTVSVRRRRDDKDIDFCVVNNQATLIWAANLASIELHTSLAQGKDLFRPTSLVFDLDPGPSTDVIDCARVARWIRSLLNKMDLESWCKTSGSKGLQMYVPLNTKVTFEETHVFAHEIAQRLEKEHPEQIVTQMKKELRQGKIFIDWSQNTVHKTTVSVYSLRAREKPTVSTPVTWSEIDKAVRSEDPERLTFEVKDVLARVDSKGDLFEPVMQTRQKLPASVPA